MAVSPKMRVRVNIIAFLVLGFGLSFLMASQVLSILQARYSVVATFPDAGGVFTNQEVTYRGVTVGQVGEMDVVDEGVEIELLIEEETQIPKEGVEARVMFKSAVGEQFVDLLPATEGAPYLEDGSKIPIENTSIPVSTQELLTTLEAVLRGVPPEALRGAVQSLGNGLTGRASDLAAIIENSADIAETFAERGPNIESILKNGTKVGRAFLNSKEDFKRAIQELVVVAEILSSNRGNLQDLLQNANIVSDELVEFLRNNRKALYETIEQLADVNELQLRHKGDLDRLLRRLPGALAKIHSAFEPDTGLVRFGLIQETANHACSYGTERRPPSDRTPKLPPKNARCTVPPAEEPPVDPPGPGRGGGTPEVEDGLTEREGPSLPRRMADWSWTLVYLNSV